MVEKAAATSVNTEVNANAANAKAFLDPANINAISIINGNSVIIEPSIDGVPEAPSGGTAAKVQGSPKTDAPGGNIGARPEGKSETGSVKYLGTGGHETNRSFSDKAQRHMEPQPHQQDIQHNQSGKNNYLKA